MNNKLQHWIELNCVKLFNKIGSKPGVSNSKLCTAALKKKMSPRAQIKEKSLCGPQCVDQNQRDAA